MERYVNELHRDGISWVYLPFTVVFFPNVNTLSAECVLSHVARCSNVSDIIIRRSRSSINFSCCEQLEIDRFNRFCSERSVLPLSYILICERSGAPRRMLSTKCNPIYTQVNVFFLGNFILPASFFAFKWMCHDDSCFTFNAAFAPKY